MGSVYQHRQLITKYFLKTKKLSVEKAKEYGGDGTQNHYVEHVFERGYNFFQKQKYNQAYQSIASISEHETKENRER